MELDSLNAELCSADVEGLYESQVPAMFRALVQMGCICRCNAAPINGTYELEVTEIFVTEQFFERNNFQYYSIDMFGVEIASYYYCLSIINNIAATNHSFRIFEWFP